MRASRIAALAGAALITAATLSGGTFAAAQASASARTWSAPMSAFWASAEGFGPTLKAAELNAYDNLISNYYCSPNYTVDSDGQYTNGTWWAWVSSLCSGRR